MTHGRRSIVWLTLFVVICALPGCDTTDTVGSAAECSSGEIVGWGDSLTYSTTITADGYRQSNPTWLEVLGEDLGVNTSNFGQSSEGSAEIAVRQGGLRPAVTLSGNQIPSGVAGESRIAAITPNDGWTQYREAGTMKMHGVLAGVRGTLQHTMRPEFESFSFVPDGPLDAAVPVPPKSVFIGDQGDDYRDCIQLIWAGTGNSAQPSTITRDIASMVNWIGEPKRYLVIGTVPAIENELADTYGQRFVNLRSWLAIDGLAAAGISPTIDDTKAIAANRIPPSLLVDGAHYTQVAYTAIGHHLASVVQSQGWVS